MKCEKDSDKLNSSSTIGISVQKNLIMKTLGHEVEKLKSSYVIYKYKWNSRICINYIGMTTATLVWRLTLHFASGGPKNQ